MFKRLFWFLLGALIAFWIFKNDPELTFLSKFRHWILNLFAEFKEEPSEAVKSVISKYFDP